MSEEKIDPSMDAGLIFDPAAFESSQLLNQKQDGETPFDGPRTRRFGVTNDEEIIIRSYLEDGLTATEIAEEHGFHPSQVKGVVTGARLRRKAERIKNEIKEKIFEEKIPVLEAIGDQGLIALYEWLESFVSAKEHLKMGTNQARELVSIITELHTMFRLQLGKSTQNIELKGAIEHSSKTMDDILQALKAPPEMGGDPFVSYIKTPQLDAPSQGVVIEMPPLESVVEVKNDERK